MSELNEARWALMSERGCEAVGLTYAEALELEHALRGERLSGLCIISEAAGRRLPPADGKDRKPTAAAGNRRQRRGSKGKPAA